MKPFRFSKKNREYIKWDKTHKEVRITPKIKQVQAAPEPLQVEADEAVAQGTYADMAVVTHTETEFVFDFIFLHPGQPDARLVSRVISTSVHAKRLCAALRENIKIYESRFGVISPEAPAKR